MKSACLYRPRSVATVFALLMAWLSPLSAQASSDHKVDYLSFAQGAVPIAIDGAANSIGTDFEHALRAIDGNPVGYSLARKFADSQADFVFTFALPAETEFNQFAIPNVLETPSPSQTFVRSVEIFGSNASATEGFELLAKTQLQTHKQKNQVSMIQAETIVPVRWVRLRLAGGINVQSDKMFYEFSELAGYGKQKPVPTSDAFTGVWKGRGVLIELKQTGNMVSGCYDRRGELTGSVSGNLLHATGKNLDSGTASSFVLSVDKNRKLRGLRSSNGAPFRLYNGDVAAANTKTHCSEKPSTLPGCGSTIHGIRFGYDSAKLLPEATPVLKAVLAGLQSAQASAIEIQGHTSSEGSDDYNLQLSQRRAQSVVDWLAANGIDAQRLVATGIGEARPIAKNDDEAGRSINRRVEIHCK